MKTIEERAKEYSNLIYGSFPQDCHKSGYIKGATEQREIDIQRACEWIEKNIHFSVMRDKIISNFKQAMEGE